MGAAVEGCLAGIPSVGFSLDSFESRADFSQSIKFGRKIFENVVKHSLPRNICLNVNFPAGDIKGVRVCRQADGVWKEDFDHRQDPFGGDYYWLSGQFKNAEPYAKDTDEYAIKDGYASVVPTKVDMTAHEVLENLKTWDYEVTD